ncbi:MAG: ABC transporter permease [Roseicyclus sp.]
MAMPDDRPRPARPTLDPAPGLRPTPPVTAPPPRTGWLSPLNRRRWDNFKANRRAYWSLWIFLVLYGLSLFAELIANDKPLLVRYQGGYYTPIFNFYSETEFGGDFRTEAVYRDIEVQCLIVSGGLEDCWDDPEAVIERVEETGSFDGVEVERGWLIWPLIPYSYNTVNDLGRSAPSPPDGDHWLGTDDTARDVAARVIYGFRLSVSFALVVTFLTSVIGIAAGAAQGYYGGVLDLIFQRIIEIWNSTPSLYIIIIISAIFTMNFWLLVFLMVLFGWTGLVGVVRAEFLRARNYEYVRAARALGVSNVTIMFRHVLPNAMVATLTFLPFIVTGTIGALASLDFLGFGLPSSAPSLGEMTLQAKNNLNAPWLGFTAFFTFAIMLSLLVFVFEGVRDAFDPRKTFTGGGGDDDGGASPEPSEEGVAMIRQERVT